MLEETEEFKLALKLVIKRQMRHLMEQLKEGGEEVVILSVNMMNKTCSHFGSSTGEWFISEQENLTNSFLNFCITHSKVNKVRANMTQSPGVAWDQRPYGLGRPQGSASPAATNVSVPVTTPVSTPVKHTPQIGQKPLAISIPKSMTTGVSEAELAGFVGRIVAAQISGAQKQTDLVQAAVNDGMSSECLASQSPPAKRPRSTQEGVTTRSTRSGRKVSAKYLEGISTIRSKSGKVKNTSLTKDASETMNQLGDINPDIGSRVEMKMAGKEHAIVSVAVENVGSLRKTVLPTPSELSQESADLYNVKTVQSCAREGDGEPADETDTEVVPVLGDGSESRDVIRKLPDPGHDTEKMSNLSSSQNMPDESLGEDEASPWEQLDDSGEGYSTQEIDITPGQTILSVPDGYNTTGRLSTTDFDVLVQGIVSENGTSRSKVMQQMKFVCELCGAVVKGCSGYNAHKKYVHEKEKLYQCEICNMSFCLEKQRKKHMVAVHVRRCENCDTYVTEKDSWIEGMQAKHVRQVQCAKCLNLVIFRSGRIRGRKDETLSETPSRPVVVKLRSETENAVSNIPSTATPSTQTPLDKTVNAKFACSDCGKLFLNLSDCERHQLTHTSIRQFMCDVCGKTYRCESNLKLHLQNHPTHLGHCFSCPICSKVYHIKSLFLSHLEKTHGIDSVKQSEIKTGVTLTVAKDSVEAGLVYSEEEMAVGNHVVVDGTGAV